VASLLGMRGIPGAAESIMVERDISVAELTGGRYHVAHMSARQSLRAVRAGKARGVDVTCEVTPHHFILTDETLSSRGGYDTNCKMNPPLREAADRDAMLEGIRDGSIDVIATDHAPHHADEKALEFDEAPFGIVGLETAVSLCLDRLVHAGVIGLPRLVELLSVNPARILRLAGGTLTEGSPADITVLAPDPTVTVDAASFASLGRNTPFDGWSLKGAVAGTIVGGREVFANASVLGRKTILYAPSA
jgi:dihydroorotase